MPLTSHGGYIEVPLSPPCRPSLRAAIPSQEEIEDVLIYPKGEPQDTDTNLPAGWSYTDPVPLSHYTGSNWSPMRLFGTPRTSDSVETSPEYPQPFKPVPRPRQRRTHTQPGIVPTTKETRLVPTLLPVSLSPPAPSSSEDSPLDTNWSPDTWSPHNRFLSQPSIQNQGSPNLSRAPGSPAPSSLEPQPRAPLQRSPPNQDPPNLGRAPGTPALTPQGSRSQNRLREFSAAGLLLLDAQASLQDGRPASAFEPKPTGKRM